MSLHQVYKISTEILSYSENGKNINCQAPGPVSGQSQHSYSDTHGKGPGWTL